MKKIIDNWKRGWLTFFRWIYFWFLVLLWLIPVGITQELLKSEHTAVFENGQFHWQPAVVFLMTIILFPFGFAWAEKVTGYFNKP